MIQDLSSSFVKKIEYKYKKIKINKILQPIRIIKTFKRPFQISAKILIIFFTYTIKYFARHQRKNFQV